MISLLQLIDLLLNIYSWVLIAYVIFSLLMAFGVINVYNKFVNVVFEFLQRVTEPVLKPIRRILPDMGGIDLAPLIVLIAIWFIRSLLWEYGPQLAA